MRLLHTTTRQLHTFTYPPPVQYAILSHTWSSPHNDEWSFYDTADSHHDSIQHEIILRVCHLAQGQRLEFIWIDAACIDKNSSAEVSKAINALPKYFETATVCFAFLFDLPCGASIPCKDTWARCRFWTRSWTLQELILPSKIQFYDAKWHLRGERSSQPLYSLISGITGIDEEVLSHQRSLQQTSVARKMSWAACREASSPEDAVYALLGLFNIRLPIVHGEGKGRAFRRLQEEILKHSNDSSLFAWTSIQNRGPRGIFADSPREFLDFGRQKAARLPFNFEGFAALTSKGVLVSGPFSKQQDGLFLDLGIQTEDKNGAERRGIVLRQGSDGIFERVAHDVIQASATSQEAMAKQVMVFRGDIDELAASARDLHFTSYKGGGPYATTCNRRSLPISIKRPSTPELRAPAGQRNPSDSTPTGSNSNLSSQPSQGDRDWVNVLGTSCEALVSDDSDDDYQSMKASQQTDVVWERPASVASEPTTVASPPQTELELARHDCQQSSQEFNGSRDDPAASMDTWEMDAFLDYDDIRARLSGVLLDQFSESQKVANHLLEKRKRWTRRGRGSKRQSGRVRKWRDMTSSQAPEFACHYYKYDPDTYIDCLKTHELSSMADIREHLWQRHRLPYYCPVCKVTFEYSADKDQHIVQRICELHDYLPYEGVSDDQYRSITRVRGNQSVRAQWFRVWDILFPNAPRPGSPYLRSGLDREVSSFRAFWRTRGLALLEECLREWLPAEVLLDQHEVQNLSSEVLSDVVTTLTEGASARSSVIRSTVGTSSTQTMWTECEL